MCHGLAIVVVGGSNLGSPARPGAFGSALATAPFSIPPHHRYRRWMGGVSHRHILFSHMLHIEKKKRRSTNTLVAPPPPPPPPPAPPANGGRISSSYSSCSGVQTGDSRVAGGCAATALGGQNLTSQSRRKQQAGMIGQHSPATCITEATVPSHTEPATTTPRAHICKGHGTPTLPYLETDICGQCACSHTLHRLPN